MLPTSEDKDGATVAKQARPSRFLVPAGRRVNEDVDSSVTAASFLSREKICGKLNLKPASPTPTVCDNNKVPNGLKHDEDIKTHVGRFTRNSSPALRSSRSSSMSSTGSSDHGGDAPVTERTRKSLGDCPRKRQKSPVSDDEVKFTHKDADVPAQNGETAKSVKRNSRHSSAENDSLLEPKVKDSNGDIKSPIDEKISSEDAATNDETELTNEKDLPSTMEVDSIDASATEEMKIETSGNSETEIESAEGVDVTKIEEIAGQQTGLSDDTEKETENTIRKKRKSSRLDDDNDKPKPIETSEVLNGHIKSEDETTSCEELVHDLNECIVGITKSKLVEKLVLAYYKETGLPMNVKRKPGPLCSKSPKIRTIQIKSESGEAPSNVTVSETSKIDEVTNPDNISVTSENSEMNIEVADEFVAEEVPEGQITPEEFWEGGPLSLELSDDDEDVDDSSAEVEVITTKSGRKIQKPKMLNFVMTSWKSKNTDSEADTDEITGEENEILSDEKMKELEESVPCQFVQGSLGWARIGVAPYWPCTVTQDPDLNIFSSVALRGKKVVREYHVQFFGRVQRAWVQDSNLMKFEGIESFNEKAEEAKKATGGAKKRLLKAFMPTSSTRAHWNEALSKMVEVKDLSNEERLQIVKKLFDDASQHSSGFKRKRLSSCSSKLSDDQTYKKPKLFPEADDLIKSIPTEVLEENRRKLKSGFKLFKLANVERLKVTDAKSGPEDIERKVSRMWNQLSHKERQFYCDECQRISSPPETENAEGESFVQEMTYPMMESEDEVYKEIIYDQQSNQVPSSSTSSVIDSPIEKAAHKRSSMNHPKEMIGVFKKESTCLLCEEVSYVSGDLLKCRGVCQNAFHVHCLGLDVKSVNQETWKCEECVTGQHPCQICKSTEGDRLRCTIVSCGKFFHRSCLKSGLWPQARFSETQLTCPAHMCHTCASDNPQDPFMKYNTKLVRCLRCPTAYHAGDFCVAAGTVQITATHIICPKHYEPPKSKRGASTHINISWCFICSQGGTLICCELCPASFHAECLQLDSHPDVYYCDSCETGKLPLYGEILWVKLGNYRWWPSRVLYPSEIPDNIERLPHDIGEFPIQFCGTKEYFWMNRGRCYPYQEGDSDRIPGASNTNMSGLAVSFRKGLAEAAQLFEEYTQSKNVREEANADKVRTQPHLKPPLYSKIKSNKPFGDCPVYTADLFDHQVCDCDPKSESPCGKDSDCINRLLMWECCPTVCKAGDKCGNMQFQRRIYPTLTVKRTSTRGWGLFVKNDVKKGDFLIEYVGELITTEEFRKRIDHMLNNKDAEQNYYYMVMDNSRVIDAGPKGNIARFMNHSCNPNCETQKWTVNGDTRIGLFALEDVSAGSELTFNYQLEAFGEVKKPCLCGAKNCSGFIGEKPSKDKDRSSLGLQSKNKKSKRIRSVKKVWEDHCYRCFEGGELLMCDFKNCPKVYHLSCVNHEKMPREKWFCPWHHCVACGKLASAHCIHCPNAYCKTHNMVLRTHPVLGKICDEHKDDFGDLLKFYKRIEDGVSRLVLNPNPIPHVMSEKDLNKNTANVRIQSKPTELTRKRILPLKESNVPTIVATQKLEIHLESQQQQSVDESFNEEDISQDPLDVMEDIGTPVGNASANSTPKTLSSFRTSEALFQCPGCPLQMRASLIRRHVQSKHPEIYTNGGFTNVQTLMKELNKARDGTEPSQLKMVAKPDGEASKKIDIAKPRPISTLNTSPISDACVPCLAPDCNKYIHHSNMARHWRCWHPTLNKADYYPKRPKSITSSSPSESPHKKKLSFDDHSGISSEQPKHKDAFAKGEILSVVSPIQYLSTSSRGWFLCNFENCDYETKYNSNMWRHRRKYNHFCDDMDPLKISLVPEKSVSNSTETSMNESQMDDSCASKAADEPSPIKTELLDTANTPSFKETQNKPEKIKSPSAAAKTTPKITDFFQSKPKKASVDSETKNPDDSFEISIEEEIKLESPTIAGSEENENVEMLQEQ